MGWPGGRSPVSLYYFIRNRTMTKHSRFFPLLLAGLALTGLAANWPSFRGPKASGVSSEKGLPAKWSDKENLVWKLRLPGPGGSSPVVWGDKVFLTCYSGYGEDEFDPGDQKNLRRHVLCVD